MVTRRRPTHDLGRLKRECEAPGYLPFADSAFEGLAELGWNPRKAVEFVQSLSASDFNVSTSGRDVAGVWHDAYIKEWSGKVVYFKFVKNPNSDRYYVTSFKESTS